MLCTWESEGEPGAAIFAPCASQGLDSGPQPRWPAALPAELSLHFTVLLFEPCACHVVQAGLGLAVFPLSLLALLWESDTLALGFLICDDSQ